MLDFGTVALIREEETVTLPLFPGVGFKTSRVLELAWGIVF
jgi:hypothetical protein